MISKNEIQRHLLAQKSNGNETSACSKKKSIGKIMADRTKTLEKKKLLCIFVRNRGTFLS